MSVFYLDSGFEDFSSSLGVGERWRLRVDVGVVLGVDGSALVGLFDNEDFDGKS